MYNAKNLQESGHEASGHEPLWQYLPHAQRLVAPTQPTPTTQPWTVDISAEPKRPRLHCPDRMLFAHRSLPVNVPASR